MYFPDSFTLIWSLWKPNLIVLGLENIWRSSQVAETRSGKPDGNSKNACRCGSDARANVPQAHRKALPVCCTQRGRRLWPTGAMNPSLVFNGSETWEIGSRDDAANGFLTILGAITTSRSVDRHRYQSILMLRLWGALYHRRSMSAKKSTGNWPSRKTCQKPTADWAPMGLNVNPPMRTSRSPTCERRMSQQQSWRGRLLPRTLMIHGIPHGYWGPTHCLHLAPHFLEDCASNCFHLHVVWVLLYYRRWVPSSKISQNGSS